MRPARVLLFDIETTNLAADFAVLLCVGYKWLGEKKVYCPAIDFSTGNHIRAEKALLKAFMPVLEEADVLVTYNGKRFDVPFLQAKALEHGYNALPNTSHVDLYWTVKHAMRISRKSLQNAGYFLGLSNEKTPVEGKIWVKAMLGDAGALRYIVKHCKADVRVLEELYYRLRSLVRGHPRVNGNACKACGSSNIHGRGRYVTKLKGAQWRTICQDCGTWEARPLRDLPDDLYGARAAKQASRR